MDTFHDFMQALWSADWGDAITRIFPPLLLVLLLRKWNVNDPAIRFPYTWKDFKRFSLDRKWRKEDLITLILMFLALLLIPRIFSTAGFDVGFAILCSLLLFFGIVSHVLIHLRTSGNSE